MRVRTGSTRSTRRSLLAAAAAWGAGFCMAAGTAWGTAKLDAWRGFGDKFQLGYVVGYLDAVALAKRHDARLWIPAGGRPDFERWRALVNDFYADPANAKRPLPDAMAAAGKILEREALQAYRERRKAAEASPGAAASGPAATPTPPR
jgi:hypothetical protein